MSNTIQIRDDQGNALYPITDASLIIGLENRTGMRVVPVDSLPTASADTVGVIYMVTSTQAISITKLVDGSYSWVSCGTLDDIDLSGYATKDELDQLSQEVTGNIVKDITWSYGYIQAATGLIRTSSLSKFSQPILLKAGEKVTIGTQNSNIGIICSTNADSVAVGDTVTVIKATSSSDQFETYEYTAEADIKIVVCVLWSNYNLSFYDTDSLTEKIGNAATKQELDSLDQELGSFGQELDSLGQELGVIQENFDLEYSANLFDKTTATENYTVRRDTGALAYDADYYASDYIYLEDGVTQIAVTAGQSYVGINGIAFYDANKTFISGVATTTATVPAGAKYVRVSIKATLLDTSMVVYGGAVPETYQPYGVIISAKLKPITLEDTDFSVLQRGKNLLNPATLITSKWIAANGYTDNVTNLYGYYDWTEVEPETAYHISNSQDGALSNRSDCYIAFYDDSKAFISSVPSNVTDITTPALCRYVRISVVIARNTDAQMELGTQRTSYEEYVAPVRVIDPECIVFPDNGVTTDKIASGAVTQDKIAPGVSLPASPFPFGSFREKATLESDGILQTPSLNVTKNTRIFCTIEGVVDSISVGVARLGFYGKWVEITQTKVILRSGTSGTAESEFDHGLTLGTRTVVIISKDVTATSLGTATIMVFNDYGDTWSRDVSWGVIVGQPFVYNENASESVSAELSFMLGDVSKDIWMFGDSYFSFTDMARWLYYPMTWGFLDYLVNARGGETATEALTDFNTILSLGSAPSFAVWCMGMNGGADSSGAVNSTWLSATQSFIAKCQEKGITPIIATIPSVPSEIHTKLNEWVRESGYRYIDFADAVEQNGTYTWRGWGTTDALLSNDEVHPSARGAIVLATRAVQDFPEIAITD